MPEDDKKATEEDTEEDTDTSNNHTTIQRTISNGGSSHALVNSEEEENETNDINPDTPSTNQELSYRNTIAAFETPAVLISRGQVYRMQGDLTSAISYFLRALHNSRITTNVPPYTSQIDVAQSHELIARTVVEYSEVEQPFNLSEAREHCLEALRIYRQELGESNEIVSDLNDLNGRLNQDMLSMYGMISEMICPFLSDEDCIVLSPHVHNLPQIENYSVDWFVDKS